MWTIASAESIIRRNQGRIETRTVADRDGEAKKIKIIRLPQQVGIKLNGAVDFLANHRGYIRGR